MPARVHATNDRPRDRPLLAAQRLCLTATGVGLAVAPNTSDASCRHFETHGSALAIRRHIFGTSRKTPLSRPAGV